MNTTFTLNFKPFDNIDLIDQELNEIERFIEEENMEQREPSSACIERILAFSKAYHVQKTKSNIGLEMILN